MRQLIIGVIAGGLCLANQQADAQTKLDDLLRRIPGAANSIAVFDVEAIHKSEISKKQGWKERHEAAYVERPVFLPPEAEKLVVGAHLFPNRDFEQVWELAVMGLTESLSMRSVARSEGGYVDEINGLRAAWTPSDAYFVSLEDEVMGVMHPAHRQAVSRWIDFGKKGGPLAISSYLKAAADGVTAGEPIVMAIDLKDAARPHELKVALESADFVKKSGASLDEVVKILTSLEGLTLRIALTSVARGELRIDFGEDATPLRHVAKDAVLEALSRFDANLNDLEKWKATTESHAIVLSGPLGDSGLRRLFSLLELPSTKFSSLKEENVEEATEIDVADASLAYFKSVSVLIDDLQDDLDNNRRGRGNHGVWMERYARRIDRLPILHVDEELLEWGAAMSAMLRDMAGVRKSSNLNAGVRKSQTYGNYNAYGYGYAYNSARASQQANAEIRTAANARAQSARFDGFRKIENSLVQMRQKMTRKYGQEF